ncbi:MAG TPA: helix-turn-helix transcriptional regulator [Chitinophagaceae bacterium]|jgi:transcriptional regulator with XRE-family HTH domain|nr:helix-turn-helix transcriptional regulator [Chitinophagaceae bacterium]
MKKKTQLNPDKELQKLGARIKQLRIKAGFTSYEYFAYENEISRTQYARYEQGKDIRYSTLLKIVAAHGMTVEEFFSEGFD